METQRKRSIRTSIMIFLAFALVATTTLLAGDARADTNPATDGFTMTCTVTPDFTPDTVIEAGVQGVVAGESATFTNEVVVDAGTIYQDILARPDGSTYYASIIELITLPSNLVLDPASVVFTIDGVAEPVLLQTTPDPTQFVLDSSGGVHRIIFPGDEAQMLADQTGFGVPSYTVAAPSQTFALSFDAEMPAGSVRGTVEDGGECFTSLSTGPSNRDTDRPRTAVVVVEPEMGVEKTTDLANAYAPGQEMSFEIIATVPEVDSATQTHAVAAPQNVEIVDTVPALLTPVDAAGAPIPDGGTTQGGGVWDATARTVTYTFGAIAPGTSVSTVEIFMVDPAAPPASTIANEACGSFATLPDPDAPRTDAGCDSAEIIVASEAPTLAKTPLRIPDGAPLEQIGLEMPFWYEITIDLPASSSYENLTIFDNLPDGLEFLGYVSATCTPAGGVCGFPIPPLTETVFPGGAGTVIGWYPDSIPFDAAARTITLRYEAQISSTFSDGTPVPFNDTFMNEVDVQWNTVDRLGDVPPTTASPPDYDLTEETEAVMEYDRPILTVDKGLVTSDGLEVGDDPAAWDYAIGDIASFTVNVNNQGSTDAWNVNFIDAPAGFQIDLATILIDGVACGASCTASGTGFQTLLAGPIAAGQTVVITYDAEPTENGTIGNNAEIPSYEDEFGTPYDENPSDGTEVEIPDPVLEITKTYDDDAPSYANTLGTVFPFTFEVENVSATTAYNLVITDVPPAGFCPVAGSLDPLGTPVTETSAGVFALTDLAPGDSVTFTADLEICGLVDPGTFTNIAELTWEDLVDGTDSGGTAYFDDDPADIEIVGPEFEVSKGPAVGAGALTQWSADLDDPEDGVQLDELNGGVWTIVVTNTGLAPIGGLNVVDPMPDPFEYLPGTATVTWLPGTAADTFTDNSVAAGSGAVWEADGYTNVADFTIGMLAPGAEIRIDVPFIHNGNSPADGDLTRLNTVEVRNDNITYDPAVHSAQGEYTLIPVEAGPEVSKTVSPASDSPDIGVSQRTASPAKSSTLRSR